jgi:threonine dehydratase
MTSPWPISLDDVRAARARLAPYLQPSPLYNYPLLDAAVGHGIQVLVKHENFNPTNSFKVRNGLSFMTALPDAQRARGVVAATRGNHGLGIAYAGKTFGVRTVICVPVGNNPDKNAGMRALGARVIEEGRDYDESVQVAQRLVEADGLALAHSTNDRTVLAGAATLSLEMFEQAGTLDAIVAVVGGGSQAVGAITVARALSPSTKVYAAPGHRRLRRRTTRGTAASASPGSVPTPLPTDSPRAARTTSPFPPCRRGSPASSR